MVPGHLADAPYRQGLSFKRRTVAVWSLMCGVAALFMARPLPVSANAAAISFTAALLALTAIRRFVAARKLESALSFAVCLASQPLLGTVLAALREDGLDLSLLGAVPVGLAIYTLLAGHDFSHFGYAALGSVFSVLCGWTLFASGWIDGQGALVGSIVASIATVYVSSDLSMLLRRRLPGEELGAAADLFRDLLNFSTYAFRVAAYRRKYRFHPN